MKRFYRGVSRVLNVCSEGDDTVEIKIMTFNIRHGLGADNRQNLSRVIDVIQEINPDIVGLNEVDIFNPRSKFTNQPERIAQKLNYYYSFAPTLSWGMMKYGNCLLSRWPIVEVATHPLPSQKEQRGCLMGVVDAGTSKVRVLTTHLGLTHQERLKQLEVLEDLVSSSIEPCVLMGDFNCIIDSGVFAPVLVDTTRSANIATFFTFPAQLPSAQIDYVFVSRQFKTLACATVKTLASDHLPVFTTVTLG